MQTGKFVSDDVEDQTEQVQNERTFQFVTLHFIVVLYDGNFLVFIDVAMHLLILFLTFDIIANCSFLKTWGKFLKPVVLATRPLLRQQLCTNSSPLHGWDNCISARVLVCEMLFSAGCLT